MKPRNGETAYPLDLSHPDPEPLLANRTVLFLDSSIWYQLARKRPPEAAQACDRLRALVQQGQVLCPVSWPLISELRKQTQASALPIAELMDECSLGLSYANDNELITAEIRQFVHGLINDTPIALAPKQVYVPITGFISTSASIVWPAGFPATPEQQIATNEQLLVGIRAMTLTRLVSGSPDNFQQPETVHDPGYQKAWKERFAFAHGDRSVMRRVEQEYQLHNVFLPELKKETDKLLFLDRLTFHARLKKMPLDQYGGAATAIFEQLPALRTKTEVMAIMGFNPHRKGTMNDFYDAEIMIAPLAYANAFAAHDRWVTHLLTNESTILSTNHVRYLPTAETLLGYLNELDQSPTTRQA